MTPTRRWVAAGLALVAAAGAGTGATFGQHSQDPARDAARRPIAPATSRIAGIVHIDDRDRTPLGGARVTITPGLLAPPMSTATGADGRFEFPNVPASNYTLVVSRPGYVTTYYGARTPGRGPGVPIAVVDGQPVPDLVVPVVPAGAISGTVRSALGRPLANVLVQATSDSILPAGGLLGQATAVTDDRGEYRLFGLAPGAYVVSVRGDIRQMMTMARPVTPEELRWADDVSRSTGAGVPPAAAAEPPAPSPPVMYAPVYFPASPDAAGATPIRLAAGEERTGIDLTVSLVTTTVVRGLVFGEDGAPAAGVLVQVEAARPRDALDAGILSSLRSARTDAAGTFAVQGVPPGDYRVTARLAEPARGPAQAPAGMAGFAAMAMMGATGSTGGPVGWYAAEPVLVQGRDLDGISLGLARAPEVTARVVYADPVPEPAPAAPVFMLMAVPAGSTPVDNANALRSSSLFVANEDGTFTARGVVPGRYLVTAFDLARLAGPAMAGQMASVPAGAWTLTSATAGGRDIADEPVEIGIGSDVADLVVTFTNRPAEIAGTVLDRADRPTGGFPIVVFSTNRAHWTPGARRTMLVRPTTSGTYRASGLPPGEYYVAAVTEVDDQSLGDPAFLEMLVPGAFTITLAAGEKKVQDLRLGGG